MAAYVAELVYKDAGTQYGKVINYNLAGYLGAVAEYAVVTYHAVMGNVHVLHEQVVVADKLVAESEFMVQIVKK